MLAVLESAREAFLPFIYEHWCVFLTCKDVYRYSLRYALDNEGTPDFYPNIRFLVQPLEGKQELIRMSKSLSGSLGDWDVRQLIAINITRKQYVLLTDRTLTQLLLTESKISGGRWGFTDKIVVRGYTSRDAIVFPLSGYRCAHLKSSKVFYLTVTDVAVLERTCYVLGITVGVKSLPYLLQSMMSRPFRTRDVGGLMAIIEGKRAKVIDKKLNELLGM